MEQTKVINNTTIVLSILNKVNFQQVLMIATVVAKACPIPGIKIIIAILTFLARFEPLIKKGVTASINHISNAHNTASGEETLALS